MNIIIQLKTIHIGERSGRGSSRVGSDFCRKSRVGSGRVNVLAGRVGSKKSDPWTTLVQSLSGELTIPSHVQSGFMSEEYTISKNDLSIFCQWNYPLQS